MMSYARGIVLIAVLAKATVAAAAGVVFDDFTQTGTPGLAKGIKQASVSRQTVTDGPRLGGVLGGVRQLTVGTAGVDVNGVDAVAVRLLGANRSLTYDSSVGATGTLQLVYDAGGRGLGADLASAKGIRIVVQAMDAAAIPCSVSVQLGDKSRSVTVARKLTQSGAQNVDFSFSSFPSLNLHTVRSVTLTISPGKAGDFQLGGISTF